MSSLRNDTTAQQKAISFSRRVELVLAICTILNTLFLALQYERSQEQDDAINHQNEVANIRYQNEQENSIRPFLAFETFQSHLHMAWVDTPDGSMWYLRSKTDMEDDQEIRQLPVVRNYGNGPAFDVRVNFARSGGKEVDELLGADGGTVVVPRHVFPQRDSRLHRLPVGPGLDKAGDSFAGYAVLTCTDINGIRHQSRQKIKYDIYESDGIKSIFLEFGDTSTPAFGPAP